MTRPLQTQARDAAATIPDTQIGTLLLRMADALDAQAWRPIETLPADYPEMIIYLWMRETKRSVGLAYKARDGGYRDSETQWGKPIRPTHWMPLPAPPNAGDAP